MPSQLQSSPKFKRQQFSKLIAPEQSKSAHTSQPSSKLCRPKELTSTSLESFHIHTHKVGGILQLLRTDNGSTKHFPRPRGIPRR